MITAIIFDLGGVLIDWNPEYLYRKLFKDEPEMKDFLKNICTPEWNEEQDAGRSLKEATEKLIKEYPDHEENIRAYYHRWHEMLAGTIEGTVEILEKLKRSDKYKIYALTNWSSETFPVAVSRFELLNWFDGVVVSGTEKIRKPFPDFYNILLDRYNIDKNKALFIDDNARNVAAAQQLGIDAIQFISAVQLSQELAARGIELT